MKIVQTPARFPPYTGGVEQYTYVLSKKLIERGHEVTVICANEPKQPETRTTYEGIDVIRIEDVGKIAQTNLTPRLPIELYREVQDADIVHTHLPTPWVADVSVAVSKLCGTPSVVTYHNDIRGDGPASYIADLYNATAMQVTLSLTNRIITTQEAYFEGSNIPRRHEDNVVTVRNGVDVDRFQPMDVDDESARQLGFETGKTNLFFLSVLDEYHDYKGLDNLIKAIDELSDEYRLIVGGDGEKKSYYERIASEHGVSNQINFSGYIPDEDLTLCYNLADCFVLPSTSAEQEGFGLVLLEALACGTPVVTTEIVGVADSIEQENLGIVLPYSSPRTIAKAITEISEIGFSQSRATQFCRGKYSWKQIAGEMVHVYKDCLD